MTEAEKLLMETEAEPEAYAEETQEVLAIDNDLRTITIPATIKNLGVESDGGVKRLHFQMPKTYGEFDLSTFDIRVNYKNGNLGDVYVVEDKAAEGDVITFSWLVGRNAVKTKGATQFIVCLKKTDAAGVVQQEFNTTLASLNVLEGLETTEQVVQANADVIEQILKKIDGLTQISPEDIANAVEEYMVANPISVPTKTSDLENNSGFITSPEIAEVGQVIVVEDVDKNGKPISWKTVTLRDGVVVIEMNASDTVVTLEPSPKTYVFPEMTELSVSRTAGREKELYHFAFASGETPTVLLLEGVETSNDSNNVVANKVYEVDIYNSIAVVREMVDYTAEVTT